MALTVAVTGPTGEIGTSVVRALEQEERVDRVLGMARRPFDPSSRGWRKTEYRQGDVLDRATVEALVAEADVVVHLAYLIVGSRDESRRINLAGSRNVFEATVSADRPRRLVKRVPLLPAEMEWVHTTRHPMLMDTTKARRELGWAPAHTAHETLTAMVDAERDRAAW
jgi:nucleoside-diphosphate-sugar epimerase